MRQNLRHKEGRRAEKKHPWCVLLSFFPTRRALARLFSPSHSEHLELFVSSILVLLFRARVFVDRMNKRGGIGVELATRFPCMECKSGTGSERRRRRRRVDFKGNGNAVFRGAVAVRSSLETKEGGKSRGFFCSIGKGLLVSFVC